MELKKNGQHINISFACLTIAQKEIAKQDFNSGLKFPYKRIEKRQIKFGLQYLQEMLTVFSF